MTIVVLGMHRSGTSAVAGMISASGAASAGPAVRNWDNARGHFEMLALVRLNEAVLAHSGGHYLSPPPSVRWTAEHAAERDRLLSTPVDGVPPLLKDPRMLLVLPLWRASAIPFRAIGVVRDRLAVARSLEAWREMPIADGLALCDTHTRALAADRTAHGYPVVDFDRPASDVRAEIAAFVGAGGDRVKLAAAYDQNLVHFDAAGPRASADGAALLVPEISKLLRSRLFADARAILDEVGSRIEPGLVDLLRGKVAFAAGEATAAVAHLEAACAVADPYFQARHLLPHALRAAGRRDEARAALLRVAGEALYPHGPLSTLAEWSQLDGEPDRALAELADAIAAAPPHRRGRLRTRRAEWLLARGDRDAARAELEAAIAEDPEYSRSREVLAALERTR